MNDTLELIRAKIGSKHLSNSYSRKGCRISMDGIPIQRILIDMDRVFRESAKNEKHCDLILCYLRKNDQFVAAPLELKGRHVRASTASSQLEQGVRYIDHVVPDRITVVCTPVLVHRSSIHRQERNRLRRHRIQFRGQSLAIGTTRCGRFRNLVTAIAAQVAKD